MITIKHILSLFIFFLIILTSCKKKVAANEAMDEEIATGKPTPPPPPLVHGVCDYDINETAIIGAGWTRSFDESFSINLNKLKAPPYHVFQLTNYNFTRPVIFLLSMEIL